MDSDSIQIARIIIAGLTIAIGGTGPAIGIGMIGKSALEAIGRNPEASDRIQPIMILLVAFAEAIAIYSLVLSLLLRFI